jgi:hypothetical protein
MLNFRYWRKMSWAILLSSAFLLVWVVASGFSPALIALALGVLGALWGLWYLTQPAYRQGRGLHLRRLQYVHVPFKTPSSTTPQDIG